MTLESTGCSVLMYSVGGLFCFQSCITSLFGIVCRSKNNNDKKKNSLIQPLSHSSPTASIYAENMEFEMWWGHTAICWLEWVKFSRERLTIVSSCLVQSGAFVYGVQKMTQSKEGSMVKNKAPLQHSAVWHTRHVFPYILGYDTWYIKRPLHSGRQVTPSMISIMAIMEDKTICY